ncbi:hypothetical protein [Streptococcus oricebi]|uniref:Uncharacterized protein n=1 Tax=Streptococcus oricebi TaxID=1547447 RepID=A0ABS5B1J1_9STRE|nr:hypothetical protein [Streptococcus oricebi]MBP2622707.1 hypothetical protein [Streptococcus oricebi]
MVERWEYALDMAKLNMNRDSNAKNFEKEAAYMYLSHFVDIKSGILEKPVPEYSNDIYFSAWIVNDDRRTYDTYLKGIQQGEAIYNGINAIRTLNGLVKGTEKLIDIAKIEKLDNVTALRASLLSSKLHESGKNLYKHAQTFKALYESCSSVEELISTFRKSTKLEDYDVTIRESLTTDILDFLLNSTAFSIGLGNTTISSLGVMSTNLFLKLSKDLIDKYRWIALVQYNDMRVSLRMMRFYGMEY